jgi:bacillithiol biosynthesis cysteine-adding enzyme BshC
MASLLQAYLDGDPGLMSAFAAPPGAVGSHPISPRPWDSALVAEMQAYQAHLGATGSFRGDESVIITGQQPGIFTGPLYTIYKAITAIRLADAVRASTGTPVVPIYWVGGDDHDFAEISQVHLLTRNHTSVPLTLAQKDGSPPRSIFQHPVDPALHELIEEAARLAPGSEFAESVRVFLHESLDDAANLSEWHARLMARLFQRTPLIFFTPELAAARRAAVSVFEQEISQPLVSTGLVNAGGNLLAAEGFGAQVVKAEDACNFFLEHGGMRCRVRYVGGEFLLPDNGTRFTQTELLDLLHSEPGRFTANVALRCIVQQHLFPVRAYVAGPGELAYWGQLRGLFDHFGYDMPVVYPRVRALLTSIKTNKLLAKLGLQHADFAVGSTDLEERALRAADQDPAMRLFTTHRDALDSLLHAMEHDFNALGKKGRAAQPPVAAFTSTVRDNLAHLERTLLRADANRTATAKGQIDRLVTELAPERKPQERYYTIFSWLFLYGWDLIPRLVGALDHQDFALQEIEL